MRRNNWWLILNLAGTVGHHRPFILFTAILFTAIFVVENINGRFWMNDLRVYYDASRAFLSGGQVYNTSFGLDSGFYKYSPFVLLLFAPYAALPFYGACVVHYLVTLAAFCMLMPAVRRVFLGFSAESTRWNTVFILSTICILNHLVRELHLGNVNMILAALIAVSLQAELSARPVKAGILGGIAVLFKPYLVLLYVPLLVHGRWKTALFAALTVAAGTLAVCLVKGFTAGISLHQQWFQAMTAHNDSLGSPHTFFSIANNHIFHLDTRWYLPATGIIAALLVLLIVLTRSMLQPELHLALSVFGLLALFPNLFITDTEHFLFCTPLIALTLSILFERRNWMHVFIFALLIVLYGGNSSDLLGSEWSQRVEDHGILGFANACIVIFATWLCMKNFRTSERAV